MKNKVEVRAILGIIDPIDNGLPNLQEYNFNKSIKIKSMQPEDINDAISDFITKSEKEIGGTCAYGVVQVYKNNLLIMDCTVEHKAVKDLKENNVTMH